MRGCRLALEQGKGPREGSAADLPALLMGAGSCALPPIRTPLRASFSLRTSLPTPNLTKEETRLGMAALMPITTGAQPSPGGPGAVGWVQYGIPSAAAPEVPRAGW